MSETERTGVLVVGGGQAGIAASEHLTAHGIPHLVLEKDRVAERWRTRRWDSLVANGPAWHDRFPGREFASDPDGFPGKEEVADYLAAYAAQIGAPLRTGVEVTSVSRIPGSPLFWAETTAGPVEAEAVIAATGAFQEPVIPPLVPETPGLVQIHSAAYRNPDQLPPGGVLVIGAGSSGAQIAEELAAAGRATYLSVGPHERPPRSYRGRDFCWWLGVLGKWDLATPPEGAEHVTIAVSGAGGGRTVDFRRMAAEGVTLLGRTESFAEGALAFAPDLAANIAAGDESLWALLDEADAHAARFGLDLPEEPAARVRLPDPACLTDPILRLDLAAAGIATLIWATGYRQDYSWLPPEALDAAGRPRHRRGVSPEPGIYYLGLPWQSRRGSSFLWGVWHDAKHVADQIAIRRSYAAHDAARRG